MARNFSSAVDATETGSIVTTCVNFPPQVSSNGIWNALMSPSLDRSFSPMPHLQVQILTIYCGTTFLHLLLRPIGIPVFVSQAIVGLLLGQSSSGRFKKFDRFKKDLFYIGSQEVLGMISAIGYTLFVFLIGVKIDMGVIRRMKKISLLIGLTSVFAPTTFGIIAVLFCSTLSKGMWDFDNIRFLAVSLSRTSFAVVACLLEDLQLLNSELGRVGLSCALVADLGSLALSIVIILVYRAVTSSTFIAFFNFGTTIGFVLVVTFVFRPMMVWIINTTPKGRPVRDLYLCAIVVVVLIASTAAERLKQTAFFGPFIMGLAVPGGPPLGSTLVSKLDTIITSIFVPLFVTVAAVKADLTAINKPPGMLLESVFVVSSVTVGKLAACFGISLYLSMTAYDAFILSIIMSSKGIVELSICSFFYDTKTLDDQIFAVMTVNILTMATLLPIVVKKLYDPAKKYVGHHIKNILEMSHDAELRILGCVHTQQDVPGLMNLLDASCPTEESPIYLYALHLIELVGRSTPVFVSHQLHDQKDSSDRSLSSNVIQTLSKYERNNRDTVAIEAFTAIAPTKLMHENICGLALEKLTSLIILPFHRKWNREGFMESDDNAIRALNCSILDRAPCSVAIFIDRGHLRLAHSFGRSNSPLFQSAVVFIGGHDDREALSLARRMTKDQSSVLMTVIRLVAEDETVSHWEKILDAELLNDVKHSFVGGEPFRYVEQPAEEGSETAAVVRAIAEVYDLVIVGRREGMESPQTSGLMEWNEFPELGLVGDMLASSDFNHRASVMVIQQQRK